MTAPMDLEIDDVLHIIHDDTDFFVEGGSVPLSGYTFVSADLEEQKSQIGGGGGGDEGDGDSEASVQFRLNQTGNIFYSTSSPQLQDKTKALFDSVTVLFAAMTKALNSKGKTLFDYEAWGQVIRGSGFFLEVQKFYKTIHIESTKVSIDTQIVQNLLPGLVEGNSMNIAKSVLSALSGEYSLSTTTESTKLAHLLFICEELFGAPSVTVRLFFSSKDTHSVLTSSPCHKSSSVTIDQEQQADTFLFVDPDAIATYASKFNDVPEEYTKLIDTLTNLIPDSQ